MSVPSNYDALFKTASEDAYNFLQNHPWFDEPIENDFQAMFATAALLLRNSLHDPLLLPRLIDPTSEVHNTFKKAFCSNTILETKPARHHSPIMEHVATGGTAFGILGEQDFVILPLLYIQHHLCSNPQKIRAHWNLVNGNCDNGGEPSLHCDEAMDYACPSGKRTRTRRCVDACCVE